MHEFPIQQRSGAETGIMNSTVGLKYHFGPCLFNLNNFELNIT
jgi:hypothetical protein